jgi:hypothetical protein
MFRPSRPLSILLGSIVLATLCVDLLDLIQIETTTTGGATRTLEAGLDDSLIFVLRSALLLPTVSMVAVSNAADWIQIVARIAGPLLLGLFAFGLRARVQR